MFERRLKIFLAILALCCIGLAVRAGQIQLWDHRDLEQRAREFMTQGQYTQTTRGKILDRYGNPLAEDAPCIAACVDYRAITEEPDPVWLKSCAEKALRRQLGDDQWRQTQSAGTRDRLVREEIEKLKGDLNDMWAELAAISGKTPDQIDDIRRTIVVRIQSHSRYLWWRNYRKAAQPQLASAHWYSGLLGDSGDEDSEIDKFEVATGEQTQSQVILPNISVDDQARLARRSEEFFALSLQPGQYRSYPMGRTACHVIGYMTPASSGEVNNTDPNDPHALRQYWNGDLVGRTGIEQKCEETLRGSRGHIVTISGAEQTVDATPAVPGQDVRLTIDASLEKEIEDLFEVQRVWPDENDVRANQHGAAVVYLIKTNEVLALVSNPGFDLQTIGDEYGSLSTDDLNLPLLNRATSMAVEPGSTVKPIVGAGAITDRIMTPTSTIQCRGVLVIDGKPINSFGHCWVYGLFTGHKIPMPSHNETRGDNLPNDMLTITDGIERSCNVVFETIADRMKMDELCSWYDRFGLGRPTGIGIGENDGRLFKPGLDDKHAAVRTITWSAGIGEGVVHATPIQMANVAATIARRGIWMRPKLVLSDGVSGASQADEPVDLHLSPDAVDAVQKGMDRVVNGHAASGYGILPENQSPVLKDDPLKDIEIAGKTGTAQVSPLSVPHRDADGNIALNQDGKMRDTVPVGTPGTEMWYQSIDKHYQHAWFIGYAPADHPQIAFCVMVEYGEAGGRVAGSIAHDVLVACVRHGYLSAPKGSD